MTPAKWNDPKLAPQGPRSRSGSMWRPIAWASIPIWSIGFLSFVPFLGYAIMQRRRRDWAVFAAYLAATVALIVAVATVRSGSHGSTAVGGFLVVLAGAAAVHAGILFRPQASLAPTALPGMRRRNQDAVAAAKSRIERRKEARHLVQHDPAMARDLRIGRPDLPRDYDDGGLVDVNHVPEAVLAGQLGMTPHEVSAVMAARSQLGRFSSADELCAYTDLSPDRVDELRDLMIFT